ncbi:MAG: hypothetical protein MUP98_13830 [Candidatus Aminicenantes bacterium]|nr:hypothetical protein [Candidatus Aminicenantes bacterium]
MKKFIKGPKFRLLLAILIACSFFMAQSLPEECDCGKFGFCEFYITNLSSSTAFVEMRHDLNNINQKYEIPVNQTIHLTVITGFWGLFGYNLIDNKRTNFKYWYLGGYSEPGDVENLTFR